MLRNACTGNFSQELLLWRFRRVAVPDTFGWSYDPLECWARLRFEQETNMRSQMTTVLYVVCLAAAIVAVDVLFFKDRFWERLTVNIGIVLVFAAFYFRFLKRP